MLPGLLATDRYRGCVDKVQAWPGVMRCDALCWLLQGCVAVVSPLGEMEAVLTAGNTFGELALLGTQVRREAAQLSPSEQRALRSALRNATHCAAALVSVHGPSTQPHACMIACAAA